MPFRHRSLMFHERWTRLERWTCALGLLLFTMALRQLLLPADWPYVYLPFIMAVPVAYFFLGRGPGLVMLPASGLVALAMSDQHNELSLRTAAGFLLYLANGAMICWLIDQLQGATLAFRDEKREKEAVLDAQTDWVARVDADGNFTYLNPAAAAVFGVPLPDGLGQPFHRVAREEDLPGILAQLATLSPENPVVIGESRLNTVGDKLVWGQFVNRALFDPQGRLNSIQTVGRDITDLKLAEAEILRLNEDLERRVGERTSRLQYTMEELESFTYSLSHDLRAPIRSINTTASILKEEHEGTISPGVLAGLDKIRATSERMSHLMDALLDLSAMGRLAEPEKTFSQADLVHAAVDMLLPEDSPRRTQVQVGDLPQAVGQPRLVQQVWVNLLSNALKFTASVESPEIFVGFDADGQAYFVRDNGAGFDARYADRIFKPFERAHDSALFAGTGIGLAIVERVVRRHGGRIWCESAPGRGSAFHFTLARAGEVEPT